MTEAQASVLVTRLIAAYPRERLDEANVAMYVERLMRLRDFAAAGRACSALIDGVQRFPTVAEIREVYLRERRDRDERLALPEMSEEQMAENRRRIAAMAKEIGR